MFLMNIFFSIRSYASCNLDAIKNYGNFGKNDRTGNLPFGWWIKLTIGYKSTRNEKSKRTD